MNQQELLDKRRKKFEELKKLRVDAAYELYCSLSDEEKLISELEFARKLVKHMGLKISTARKYAGYLVVEYHVEFFKYKMRRPSFGFAGKHHNAKTRAAISEATKRYNKARAIKCKEQGVNYRTYKQDADQQLSVDNIALVNFCKRKQQRINTIDNENIVI